MKKELFKKLLNLLSLEKDQNYDVLDFGCGSGRLLGKLHKVVGDGSRLIGFESSQKSVEEGRLRYPNVEFQHEKFIDAFSFPDECFDLFISIDTMECIPDMTVLLSEIHRILKKDAQVLIAHWDWDTQVYHSGNKEGIRKLVAAFSNWQQGWMDACDGQMGRKLWGLFQSSGLFRGEMDVFTLVETEYEKGRYGYNLLQGLCPLVKNGQLDRSEYDMVLDEMQSLYSKGEYFYSLNSYIYAGRKIELENNEKPELR